MTIAELWPVYAEVVGPSLVSWPTEAGRGKHIVRLLGHIEASQLTKLDVQRLYVAVRRREPARKVLPDGTRRLTATATRNREVQRLHHMMTWAVEYGLLAANPIAGIKLESEEDNVRDFVVDEPKLALLLATCDPLLRALILVAFDSGMRQREVRRLRRSQVDFATGRVSLAAKDTKTKSARGGPRLTKRALDAIRELPTSIISDYIFPNPEGQPWSRSHINDLWDAACARVGLEGYWFHDLRRSFVTLSRRLYKVPESVIMMQTGHRTPGVFKRYNIVDEDDCDEALQRREEGIARALKDAVAGERIGPQRSEPKPKPVRKRRGSPTG